MNCPKCRLPFTPVTAGDQVVQQCARCDGVWVTHELLHALMQAATAAAGIARKAVGLIESAPRPDSHQCPACASTTLERVQLRAIDVERCPACRGVFLDRGELKAIAQRLIEAETDWRDAEAVWKELRSHGPMPTTSSVRTAITLLAAIA